MRGLGARRMHKDLSVCSLEFYLSFRLVMVSSMLGKQLLLLKIQRVSHLLKPLQN